MFTILPHPDPVIPGTTARQVRNVAPRRSSMIEDQVSSVTSANRSVLYADVAVTSTPTDPRRASTSATIASISADDVRSAATGTARPSLATISAAAASARLGRPFRALGER